jgi:hypothetical protein
MFFDGAQRSGGPCSFYRGQGRYLAESVPARFVSPSALFSPGVLLLQLLAAAHGDDAIVFHAYTAALLDFSTLVHGDQPAIGVDETAVRKQAQMRRCGSLNTRACVVGSWVGRILNREQYSAG